MVPSQGACKAFVGTLSRFARRFSTLRFQTRNSLNRGPATVSSERTGSRAIVGRVTRPVEFVLTLVVLGCLAGAAAGSPVAGACGRPGVPACPLQRWMRERASVAHAARDPAALASVLEQAAALNPEPVRWRKWTATALTGAARVRRGSAGAAMTACVSCHDAFRTEYAKSHRTRRLPAK
jgi:hypothetical protein